MPVCLCIEWIASWEPRCTMFLAIFIFHSPRKTATIFTRFLYSYAVFVDLWPCLSGAAADIANATPTTCPPNNTKLAPIREMVSVGTTKTELILVNECSYKPKVCNLIFVVVARSHETQVGVFFSLRCGCFVCCCVGHIDVDNCVWGRANLFASHPLRQ